MVGRAGGGQGAPELHPSLLQQVPYAEVERATIVLPAREHQEDYVRHPVQPQLMVPEVY